MKMPVEERVQLWLVVSRKMVEKWDQKRKEGGGRLAEEEYAKHLAIRVVLENILINGVWPDKGEK